MTIKERERKKKEARLKALGQHIRSMRLEKGITGVELGYQLNIDKQSISRIETGKVNPSIYILKQICEVLEIDLEVFFKKFIAK